MTDTIRPRVYYNPFAREWACSDDTMMAYGWGATPRAAWRMWRRWVRLYSMRETFA